MYSDHCSCDWYEEEESSGLTQKGRKTGMRKRRLWNTAAAACMGICLAAGPVSAAAEYTVTLRPGNVARFTEEFLQEYIALGAQVTEKTGSIKVKVPAGGTIPMLPTPEDLVYESEYEDRYVMNTDWYPQTNVVSGNEDLVVKYDAVTDAVEYRIRYVDSQSEEDVAPPVIAQGNVGDSIDYFPEQVENYICDSGSQSLTLSENSEENEITFFYTSTAEPIVNEVEVPGDTITRTETVPGDVVTQTETVPGDTTVINQPAGTTGTGTAGTGTAGTGGTAGTTGTTGTGTAGTGGTAGTTGTTGTETAGTGTAGTTGTGDTAGTDAAGTGTGTAADGAEGTGTQTAGEGTENIAGEDVPLGQTDLDGEESGDAEGSTSEIEDEDVPLGQTKLDDEESTDSVSPVPFVAAGAVVVAAAAGAALYFIKRKK